MNTKLIKGIAVLVLLIVGWLVATYFVAKRAKGRRERRFTIRAGVAFLLGILIYSALDYSYFKNSGTGLFVCAMYLALILLRRKQREIRREEAANG
jgi:cell division protein FtsW (lipid II flippase)